MIYDIIIFVNNLAPFPPFRKDHQGVLRDKMGFKGREISEDS